MGDHSHTNPNVNDDAHNHSFNPPSTNTDNDTYNHGWDTGVDPDSENIPIGGGGLVLVEGNDHTHPISNDVHNHSVNIGAFNSSNDTHGHSQGNTGVNGVHVHSQEQTQSEVHLPPFIELYAIVAT